jgi:soluble lytic murein transglycosylase-like protein
VRIGVAYLREMVDRYASVRAALAAYNWGPGEIDARLRDGGVLPVRYAERVLGAYLLARRTDS